ncbi:MAG: alpha/beta fold hydrolase [Planctomycetota bacterium]|jgi:haloalkane dehalogenase
MMKTVSIVLGAILVLAVLFAVWITRDGTLVTPVGEGRVTLPHGEFEAFPLPDYAAALVTPDYESYLVEVEPGIKIHVLEVGTGYPVYLQHGNPTSGFLYRKVAAELPTDRLRLVMPTLVGLGFSSKIPASEHRLENHVRWMSAALAQLGLDELVFVSQDWGGPVGMGALARMPGVLQGLVVMNTGFNAPREQRDISRLHALVKTPILGELLTERLNPGMEGLRNVQGDPDSITPEVMELYGRPIAESGNAKARLAMMRMVPDGPDHPSSAPQREVERYVETLDVPVEIVWGTNDPILGPALEFMKANFPDAPVTETEAGHFLQEEVPDVIARAILDVVAEVQRTGARPD